MLELNAHAFVSAVSVTERLAALCSIAEKGGKITPDSKLKGSIYQRIISDFDGLNGHLKILGADMTEMALKRYIKTYRSKNETTVKELGEYVKDISSRLQDELENIHLFCVDKSKHEYLGAFRSDIAGIYGQESIDKFPNSLTDLGEAATCLAVARNTACVFHLMRAAEAAVKDIGTKLGVTVIDKNNVDLEWGKILANITAAVEAMPKSVKRNKWSEVVSLLYHMKQAWRNDTMHPKETYTDPEAIDVFNATRSFLRHLAPLI